MKNNGWGLRMELVFVLMFLVCLCVSTILLNKVGLIGPNGENVSATYKSLENRMVEASKKYVIEYYEGSRIDSTKIIRYRTLLNSNYITELKDSNGNECSGYVVVEKVNNSLIYTPYIYCTKYKSSGYDNTKDW